MSEKEPWYQEGVKFKCTGCGKCCLGKEGYVFVTPEEVATMADHLRLSVEAFALKYLRQVGTRFSLLEVGSDKACIFLKNKKECMVYENRPMQCQTFPFWPQTIKTKAAWEKEKEECEGIYHPEAPLIPYEQIEAAYEKQLDAERRY